MTIVQWIEHIGQNGKQLIVSRCRGDHGPKSFALLLPVNTPNLESRVQLIEGAPKDIKIVLWIAGKSSAGVLAQHWQLVDTIKLNRSHRVQAPVDPEAVIFIINHQVKTHFERAGWADKGLQAMLGGQLKQ